MTPADFRRIALSLEGAEEVEHAGLPAFRVGGTRFASLASQSQGYGNLTLTPELQAAFVEEAPDIFRAIPTFASPPPPRTSSPEPCAPPGNCASIRIRKPAAAGAPPAGRRSRSPRAGLILVQIVYVHRPADLGNRLPHPQRRQII